MVLQAAGPLLEKTEFSAQSLHPFLYWLTPSTDQALCSNQKKKKEHSTTFPRRSHFLSSHLESRSLNCLDWRQLWEFERQAPLEQVTLARG